MATTNESTLAVDHIPSISELCEKLGYRMSASRSKTPLTKATHAWRQQYKAPNGTPGKAFLDWLSPATQRGLSMLTQAFLESDVSNHHQLWPSNNRPRPHAVPEYPEDRQQIFMLLKKLFWRQNIGEFRRENRNSGKVRDTSAHESDNESLAPVNSISDCPDTNCADGSIQIATAPDSASTGLETPHNYLHRDLSYHAPIRYSSWPHHSFHNSFSYGTGPPRDSFEVQYDESRNLRSTERPSTFQDPIPLNAPSSTGTTSVWSDSPLRTNGALEEQSKRTPAYDGAHREYQDRQKKTMIVVLKLGPQKHPKFPGTFFKPKTMDSNISRMDKRSTQVAMPVNTSFRGDFPALASAGSDNAEIDDCTFVRKSSRKTVAAARFGSDVHPKSPVRKKANISEHYPQDLQLLSEKSTDSERQGSIRGHPDKHAASASQDSDAEVVGLTRRRPKAVYRPLRTRSSRHELQRASPGLTTSHTTETNPDQVRNCQPSPQHSDIDSQVQVTGPQISGRCHAQQEPPPASPKDLIQEPAQMRPMPPLARPETAGRDNSELRSKPAATNPELIISYWLIKSRTPRLASVRLRDFSLIGMSLDVLFAEICALTSRTDIDLIHFKLQTSHTEQEVSLTADDLEIYKEMKTIFSENIKDDARASGNTKFRMWIEPNPAKQREATYVAVTNIEFDFE